MIQEVVALANSYAPGVGAVAIVLVFLAFPRADRRRAIRIHPGNRPLSPSSSRETSPRDGEAGAPTPGPVGGVGRARVPRTVPGTFTPADEYRVRVGRGVR